MSSQSGSSYNGNRKTNKSKKVKAQPIDEKRSRRSVRKNNRKQQNQNPLPQNVPISQSQQLTIYHSFQLEVTKNIIQIPIIFAKNAKIQKQVWTRVGETILFLKLYINQQSQLIIQSKIKQQPPSHPEQLPKKAESPCSPSQSQSQSPSPSPSIPQSPFLLWGKLSYLTSTEISTRTIKQSLKILNSDSFTQLIKNKVHDVHSDMFLVLSMKRKIQCVNDHNGLINQGNTCYMNSYLQMLSHISEFKNLVYEAEIEDQSRFPATLQLLFYKLDNQQKPVSAEQLVKSFGWTKKQVNIQQDAQEFSCLFYDVLDRKLQEACPQPKHMSMSNMFQGKMLHIIRCVNVSNVLIYTDFSSAIEQPFFNIPLAISGNLAQSLDDYVSQQVLNGDNMYLTQQFGPQQAHKSVRFQSLPPITMIQLKRFQFNYNTGKNEKIMHRFEYPATINFSKWQIHSNMDSNQDSDFSNQYELYAVLVHEGLKAESGHYYAYVKIFDSWYRFNDQQVSKATKFQVFDYNYGGEYEGMQFQPRELRVQAKSFIGMSTAYMLVYVRSQLKNILLEGEPCYPTWLKEHEMIKQEEREQMRNRKNYYHDVRMMDWEKNFKGCVGDYLGLVMKNGERESTEGDRNGNENCNGIEEEMQQEVIERLGKSEKIQDWVKEYNQKGIGVYLYLTNFQKTEYETLINLQHRKTTFQQIIRDPNCPINFIFFPIIANLNSYIYIIKLSGQAIKIDSQGEQSYELQIKFHDYLEISRNSRNSQLIAKLKAKYEQENYKIRYYYEQKKQLTQIKEDNALVKGPLLQRNILGIIIVQKIHIELVEKFDKSTQNWYNDLKNYVEIIFRSEDGSHSFQVEIDQNGTVQSLRKYIFQQKMNNEQSCPSPQNIVLKARPKKTAKNYIQVTGAKTIRDLIKNCDKENIIVYSFSKLKADERINQVEIKFMYRFQNFTFSDIFHVILDRKSENQSYNIYQKIAEHEEVRRFKEGEKLNGIRIFLFSKDRNVINDIVSQAGYVHGKGEIAQVLQKQKGSHLVVEGFETQKIQENICPVLLHHRSQSDQKIGIPRYLQFDRSTKLTKIFEQILELIKDQQIEWQQKKIKVNPMKVTVYAYAKDYNKGIYILDEQSLIQSQIHEIEQKLKQQEMQDEKPSQSQSQSLSNQNSNHNNGNLIVIDEQKQQVELNKENEQKQIQKQKGQEMLSESQEKGDNNKENQIHNINQKQMNDKNIECVIIEDSADLARPTAIQNSRKNSANNNGNGNGVPQLKSWDKTLQIAFPKSKYIKIVVHHLYLTKAQTAMKINV